MPSPKKTACAKANLTRIQFDVSEDGLTGATWSFYLAASNLLVDSYCTWSRASRRSKPVVIDSWSRLRLSYERPTLTRDQVPLTQEVCDLAKRLWLAQAERNLSVCFSPS